MKKIGIIVFVVCVVIGLGFANFFSFGRLTNRLFNFKIDVGNNISGSGKTTTEKRDVTGFSSIEVNGIFQVEVVSGKDYSVEVQADDNIVPIIQTNVGGTVLHIDLDQKVSTKNDMIVRVSMPNIERVESSGASKVNVTNIKNDSFSLETSGASKVSLAGETAHLNIETTGASNIDAEQLKSVRADVEASGACKIAVNVSDELHSEATGASRITYLGDPKTVDNHQTGVGSISKK
jgi:hypothetical protein